jgi:phage shock protein A
MGLFGRFVDVIKSNVNDLVDRAEDPEKMVKLMVQEMQEAVMKATSSLAQAKANRNRLENKYKMFQTKSEDWQNKAKAALQAGNENLAREALAKKASMDQQAAQFKTMFEQADATASKMEEQVGQLKIKLEEARTKEQTLIARSRHAEAQADIAKKVGGMSNNSFAKFDKFEEKIMQKEAEAQAFTEMADSETSLDDQFRDLEKKQTVDDELAKLRAEMGQ